MALLVTVGCLNTTHLLPAQSSEVNGADRKQTAAAAAAALPVHTVLILAPLISALPALTSWRAARQSLCVLHTYTLTPQPAAVSQCKQSEIAHSLLLPTELPVTLNSLFLKILKLCLHIVDGPGVICVLDNEKSKQVEVRGLTTYNFLFA
ncbi:hypothetical protein JOB18_033451 [Solea senegalensis]|uniref:Uncharacterized protein n=1 Tax=Solea senegalensis TaxID=28829 RepID=A0AAV6SLU2_SOLSE|nr:hypothetical protein JOB18_033451 [Solea senegalensis]